MKFLKIVRFIEVKDDNDPLADLDSKELENITYAIEDALEDQIGCLGDDGNGNTRKFMGVSYHLEIDEDAKDVESAVNYGKLAEDAVAELQSVHSSLKISASLRKG